MSISYVHHQSSSRAVIRPGWIELPFRTSLSDLSHFCVALELTFRTPSDGDLRIFQGAFCTRTAERTSAMLSYERRCTTHLHPWRVVWVSFSRQSKRTKSNICPSSKPRPTRW